ncbi:MAG: T9SS type A sorting domain-containing protein, partial [bacterium]
IEVSTSDQNITIYPNPVSGMLTIQSSSMIQSVSIYDLGGKAVKQTTVEGGTAIIDLSGLDAGMYLVGLQETGGKLIMDKIIKQ